MSLLKYYTSVSISEYVFLLIKRSKEVVCRYMSFGTQSEELVTLMWLWSNYMLSGEE